MVQLQHSVLKEWWWTIRLIHKSQLIYKESHRCLILNFPYRSFLYQLRILLLNLPMFQLDSILNQFNYFPKTEMTHFRTWMQIISLGQMRILRQIQVSRILSTPISNLLLDNCNQLKWDHRTYLWFQSHMILASLHLLLLHPKWQKEVVQRQRMGYHFCLKSLLKDWIDLKLNNKTQLVEVHRISTIDLSNLHLILEYLSLREIVLKD